MTLRDAIQGIKVKDITGNVGRHISSVSYDSRRIKKGALFFAMQGVNSDGHLFIHDAIKRGATMVIYDRDIETERYKSDGVTYIKVEDSRSALSFVSSLLYGEPSKNLKIIGITGTNGKTTTSYIIKSILESCNMKTGLIGTIQYVIGDRVFNGVHTTPESLEFQSFLKKMVDDGCDYVISEVSSHALSQKRVDNVSFDIALFTNLSRDHLDFHGKMEDYFKAKERLFLELLKRDGEAIVNRDDAYGKSLIQKISGNMITYGINKGADIRAEGIEQNIRGLSFGIEYKGNVFQVKSKLKGFSNVYNILAAFATGIVLKVTPEDILSGIHRLENVKGRFESIECGQDFLVIIDYAHTDDALKNLIQSASTMLPKRIITVFGCGGNRDAGKRSLMGRICTSLSDIAILTSDNPRYESPGEIIKDIEKGAVGKYIVELDREKAIEKAISLAEKDDMVLIAGKGHEDYQEIKGMRYPFHDREVAERYIKKKLRDQNLQKFVV